MQLIAVIFSVLLFTQYGASGACNGIGGCINTVFDGVQAFKNAFYQLSNSLASNYNQLVSVYSSFKGQIEQTMGTVSSGVQNLLGGVKCLVDTTKKCFDKAIQTLRGLKDCMLGVGEASFEVISNDMMTEVKDIRMTVEDALKKVDVRYQELARQMNQSIGKDTALIFESLKNLHRRYDNVPNVVKGLVSEKIKALILLITKDVHECANKMVEPANALYRDAKDTIYNILPKVEAAVNSMESCTRLKQAQIMSCANGAKTMLPPMAQVTVDIKKIIMDMNLIQAEELLDRKCISDITKEMDDRIRVMTIELKAIIDSIKSGKKPIMPQPPTVLQPSIMPAEPKGLF